MKMTTRVMEMRQLIGGLEIPAHGEVALKPGGYHLMFMALKHPMVKGETVKATLTFAHAGQVSVDFPVMGVGAASGDMKGNEGCGAAAQPRRRQRTPWRVLSPSVASPISPRR